MSAPAVLRRARPARILAALAALVLAASLALAGCAAPAEEPVRLTIKVPRTSHSVTFDPSVTQIDQVISAMAADFSASYDGPPVEITVEVFEQGLYDEAIIGALGTDHEADILYGDFFNMSTYVHTGRVVPLDDVVTDERRADIYDYLWDRGTVGGRVYLLPYLARQNVLAYNKELFRQAGLESFIDDDAIQSWTLAEWEQVLDTLAARLPEGAYPLMMYAHSSQGDTHTMTLLRCCGARFFDEDGRFALSEPEGVAGLRWIQSGVARGWYPPHAENLEIEDCSSLFRNGQLALYMVNNVSIGRYGDSIGLVNFPGPGPEGCATSFVSGFEVFDNGDAQKVQVAKDFLAYVYGDSGWLDYAAGTLPASRAVAERYGADTLSFALFQANAANEVDFTGSNPDTLAVREVFHECMGDLLRGDATPEETARAIDERCNRAVDEGWAASVLHE